MNPIAVTNNSLITQTMGDKDIFSQIIFSHCSFEDVLRISLGMVKNGHSLLLHPLLGAVPPYEAPFKTVVLTEKAGVVDFRSLRVLSAAQRTAEDAINARTKPFWGKNDLEDFKTNDLVLVERWLAKVYFPERVKMREAYNKRK